MRLLALSVTLAAALAAPGIAAAADAQAVFLENCSTCHGEGGKGDTELGAKYRVPNFTKASVQKDLSDAEIRKAITDGVPKTKMKGWKGILTAEEIEALARFVRTFGPAK
jgi:cytochrome c oxidase cbb3-type subunit 3